MLICFGIFLWKTLPETKNKTYEEIYKMFATKDKDEEAPTLAVSQNGIHIADKSGKKLFLNSQTLARIF